MEKKRKRKEGGCSLAKENEMVVAQEGVEETSRGQLGLEVNEKLEEAIAIPQIV